MFLMIIFCIIIASLLVVSLYYNWKHAQIILEVQDAIEESLDELDVSYSRISKILEKPIFFDSVEVRQAISDIDDARQAVLKVANVLVKSVDSREDSDA